MRGHGPAAGAAVLERDVRPPAPYRLPGAGRDGLVRRRGGGLVRLLHLADEPVVVRAWAIAGGVRLRAEAASRAAAAYGVERMRFALGLDDDPRPAHRRFAADPLIGPVVHRRPWLRPYRAAEPFQALAWAITEQLIEWERATGIQRRLVWRYGRASRCRTLRDAPSPAALAARAPAELEACDLSAGRALALVRAGREVAAGRIDLAEYWPARRRLLALRGIGAWTVEKLAFHGQGRDDELPAGDLAYLKLVGQLEGLGRRADEEEVRAFFAPYAPHAALAGVYLLAAAMRITRLPPRAGAGRPVRAAATGPRPAAARS